MSEIHTTRNPHRHLARTPRTYTGTPAGHTRGLALVHLLDTHTWTGTGTSARDTLVTFDFVLLNYLKQEYTQSTFPPFAPR